MNNNNKTKITNLHSIATWSPKEDKLVTLSDVEILIENGTISEIAPQILDVEEEIDANGALITPGFIDSHTHPIFFGNRADEFIMRNAGKTYQEIAASGGGILDSVQNVRKVNENRLFDDVLERTNYFLNHGTTTIEAKSGYGLTTDDELKSLQVIKRLNKTSKLDFIPTFMGAHAIPHEYTKDSAKYIELLCKEMIPIIAKENLAEYCDVFCEVGYFSVSESKKILKSAIEHGLKIRLHADEFVDSGAAELAAEMKAVSADHLMAVSDAGIQHMADSGVIATLLPGTTLFLGKSLYANGRKLIDNGCEVALATDYNPGSSTLQSMPLIISLATIYCGLTVEEAFKAATWNGARALNREKTIGSICAGYQADLLFWDIQSINEIPYWMGSDRILNVMKKGELLDMN